VESNFNISKVHENADGSFDYGIFQINSHYWCNDYQSHSENFCHMDCRGLARVGEVGEDTRLFSHDVTSNPHPGHSLLELFKESGIPLTERTFDLVALMSIQVRSYCRYFEKMSNLRFKEN
jgi:hypothetical protein